jgi:undecaprenyl-diphosphatase
MQEIIQWDWQATLFLNDWGPNFLDQFFLWITEKYNSIPFHVVLLYMIWKTHGTRNTIIVLICVAAMIAASDQLANFTKHSIERWRPFRDAEFSKLVSIIGKQQGSYGFYSGHASSTMSLATFIFFLFNKQWKWIVIATVIWAIIVTYSRVYLGVHYLGDILAGSIVGILLGTLFFGVFAFAKARYGKTHTTA